MNRTVVPRGSIRRHMNRMRGNITPGATPYDSGLRLEDEMTRIPQVSVEGGQTELAGYMARAAESARNT